jgi:inhibitor of cysteine peptidase
MDSGVRIISMSGEVGVRPHGDETAWKPARMSTILEVDNHIKTGEDSSCVLSLSDMTTYVMPPETEIILNTPAEKDSKLKLLMGKIWTNVKLLIKDGSMEIEMNEAVCGVKDKDRPYYGSKLICEQNPASSTVKVTDGTASVISKATGDTASLNAGEMITATSLGLSAPEEFDATAEEAYWESYLTCSAGECVTIDGKCYPEGTHTMDDGDWECSQGKWSKVEGTYEQPTQELMDYYRKQYGCDWAGTWSTNWEGMVLHQSGNEVSGTYTWEQGTIVGTVTGDKLKGTWSQAGNNRAGDFEFTISDDCKSFTGPWRYGSEGGWVGDWTGTRVG